MLTTSFGHSIRRNQYCINLMSHLGSEASFVLNQLQKYNIRDSVWIVLILKWSSGEAIFVPSVSVQLVFTLGNSPWKCYSNEQLNSKIQNNPKCIWRIVAAPKKRQMNDNWRKIAEVKEIKRNNTLLLSENLSHLPF